ncbi:MAG: ribosome maturation factor RimP [Actinomycetes bacterium]
MTITEQVTQAIAPAIVAAGFYLEDVQVLSPGRRRTITCIVDGESSLNLDEVTAASKIIAEILDTATFLDETPFTLEVTSPGVDRPLTHPRHWRKNLTRLVRITLNNGEVVEGRIQNSDEVSVSLVTSGKVQKEVSIDFSDIKRALVEIEFNRKDSEI